ncbi:hypothetical protein [Mesorhizobium sp.]|nr:hypothetical protein [Mesorhizobium sp.]
MNVAAEVVVVVTAAQDLVSCALSKYRAGDTISDPRYAGRRSPLRSGL